MHYDEPDYDHDKALSGDFFQEFIRRQLNNHSRGNNWFLPQHQFLSPKTHYWKYEWGFGKKVKRWVYDKTGIEIKPQEVTYTSISPIEVKTQKTAVKKKVVAKKKQIKKTTQQKTKKPVSKKRTTSSAKKNILSKTKKK